MADQRNDEQLGQALRQWVSSTHAFSGDEVRAVAAERPERSHRTSFTFAAAAAAFVLAAGTIGWLATRDFSNDPSSVPATETPDTSAPIPTPAILPTLSGCDVPATVRGPNDDVEPAFSAVAGLALLPAGDVVAVNSTMPELGASGIAIAIDPTESLPSSTEQAVAEAAGSTPVVVVRRCATVTEAEAAATALRSSGGAVNLTEETGGFSVSVDTLRGLVELAGPPSITTALVNASGVDPNIVEVRDDSIRSFGG